jgi:hypothetical protein
MGRERHWLERAELMIVAGALAALAVGYVVSKLFGS